jgi:hypothetical protein
LNVFQSAAESKPVHAVEAVEILIPSVPLDVIGLPDRSTPVVDVHVATLVTVPRQVVLLLNVFQSVELKKPLLATPACVIVKLGVLPPLEANGAEAVTDVTVPTDQLLSAERSYDVPFIVNCLV